MGKERTASPTAPARPSGERRSPHPTHLAASSKKNSASHPARLRGAAGTGRAVRVLWRRASVRQGDFFFGRAGTKRGPHALNDQRGNEERSRRGAPERRRFRPTDRNLLPLLANARPCHHGPCVCTFVPCRANLSNPSGLLPSRSPKGGWSSSLLLPSKGSARSPSRSVRLLFCGSPRRRKIDPHPGMKPPPRASNQ